VKPISTFRSMIADAVNSKHSRSEDPLTFS